MGASTAISWTDHTFNPWWGCKRVSPGCDHCYAATFAKRTGHDGLWSGDHRFFGDAHWAEPLKWNAQAERDGRQHLVFCASMADVFEDNVYLDGHRRRLWELIERTPHLTWQLLTKRPAHVRGAVPGRWFLPPGRGLNWDDQTVATGWPSNVWIGTTVEDQQRADERIPHLLDIPAPVRFLSCEPLLGPVDLSMLRVQHAAARVGAAMIEPVKVRTIDWVIVGGESGQGHRPLDLDHARKIVDRCEAAGVPVFFKQVGGRTPTAGGDMVDGRVIKQFPAWLNRGVAGAQLAKRAMQ